MRPEPGQGWVVGLVHHARECLEQPAAERTVDPSQDGAVDRGRLVIDAAGVEDLQDRAFEQALGMFDPAIKEKLAKTAYGFAESNNIEIVTIVAKDLQGRSADQYALDAMRQLRVGKLEVGNGAVLVVAPESRQTGIALGAGLLVEYEDSKPLRGYLESFLKLLDGGTKPPAVLAHSPAVELDAS